MNYSKTGVTTVFHGSLDSIATKHLDLWWDGETTVTGERHIIEKTRTLRYRFYPHFHPYVRELAKRLIEKSVPGLQAADTDYRQNPDGTFETLPFSFQVALPKDLALKLPKPGKPGEFEAITLPGSVTVTLLEVVKITLVDGNEATLPGSVIAHDSQRGVRVVQGDGKPADLDIDTISDVILHLRYTAREGGGLLRNGAVAHLKTRIDEAQAAGSVRLFSIRHEFPTEWAKFTSPRPLLANQFAELTLNLREEHYPFWSRGRLDAIRRVDLFAKPTKDTKSTLTVSNKLTDEPVGTKKEDRMAKDASLGGVRVGTLTNIPPPKPLSTPTDQFTLYFDDNSMENLWLVLTWGKGA